MRLVLGAALDPSSHRTAFSGRGAGVAPSGVDLQPLRHEGVQSAAHDRPDRKERRHRR